MRSCVSENPDSLKRELVKRIDEQVSTAFRETGYTGLPVDKMLLYVKLCITLEAILKDKGGLEEYKEAVKRALGIKPPEKPSEESLASFSVNHSFQAKLSRLKTLRVSDILSRDSTPQEVMEYIWYRKTGVIRRHKSGGFIVDAERLKSVGNRGSITARDINKYLGEIPSSLWGKIVSGSMLEKMSKSEIIEFASRFYGRNPSIDRRIDQEVASRLSSGWPMSFDEYRRIEKIVSKVSSRIKREAIPPYALPFINTGSLTREEYSRLVERLEELPLRDRWRIVDKIYRSDQHAGLLKDLGAFTLAGVGNPERLREPSRSKSLLGKALMSYISFLLTRDPSYLDYSLYLAGKVDPDSLEPGLRRVYEGLVSRDSKRLLTAIARQNPAESVEALSYKVWEHASLQGRLELEPGVLKRAVEIGCAILNRAWSRRGRRAELKPSTVKGRVDVRKTMYRRVRMDDTILYRRRERRARVVGVVDVSGSMSRFSLWSILSLASISPVLSGVVIFSEKPTVYKGPGSKSQKLVVRYLENLFRHGFKGYTNISSALREAYRFCVRTGSNTIVLFSDLQQTVQDVDPWIEAGNIAAKGLRIIVFAPSRTDERVVDLMKRAGCLVETVPSPEKIPKILKRKLNV
ncbi:MAG: VWA domain-containing protein [Thermosphaera sp.]